MLAAVDKADSAQYTMEDVLNPKRWELLSFLMDPVLVSGDLGDSGSQTITWWWTWSIIAVTTRSTKFLTCRMWKSGPIYISSIRKKLGSRLSAVPLCTETSWCSICVKKIQFMLLTASWSMHCIPSAISLAMWCGGWRNRTRCSQLGNQSSIVRQKPMWVDWCFNGGGGHQAAGTCQIDNDEAEKRQQELIEKLTADG